MTDTLTDAAAKMREQANRQAPAWFDRLMPDYYDGIQPHEADFIASWHPAVALAVADLIEWHAAHDVGGPSWRLAHAAAGAYLGGAA